MTIDDKPFLKLLVGYVFQKQNKLLFSLHCSKLLRFLLLVLYFSNWATIKCVICIAGWYISIEIWIIHWNYILRDQGSSVVQCHSAWRKLIL